MDIKEQVKIWVEKKLGKIIDDDLNDKILKENSQFDVEDYVNSIFGKYLLKNDTENLKKSRNTDSYNDLLDFELENLTGEQNNLKNSLGFETNEKFSTEELIENLKSDSEEVVKNSLLVLETSVEDLINQSSWNKIAEALQNVLNKMRDKGIQILIIKVFCKILKWHRRPQISSKGFATVARVIAGEIDLFNFGNRYYEKIYDIKEKKWFLEKQLLGPEHLKYNAPSNLGPVNPEVLIKLMGLLIEYQHQIRVNETKYREIIFSFIQLLSSSTSENKKISGLELVSVLSPRASWCHSWCHTAVGRSLLCSALRKHKNFFVQIIQIILNHMKKTKTSAADDVDLNINFKKSENYVPAALASLNVNRLDVNRIKIKKTPPITKYSEYKSNTSIRSASSGYTRSNNTSWKRENKFLSTTKWLVEWIPSRIVKEAVFLHCVSFVTCLIKYRSGRALFPIQTAKKRRLLTVQDISLSLIEYLENMNYYKRENSNVAITSAYHAKVMEILDVLKKLSAHINSSRMSAKKPQFSH